MKNFIVEFKQFAVRGNVIDLAVAVVIGTAFAKITASLVDNIIMPILGMVLGGVDFSTYAFTFGKSTITYGVFIQSVIEFALIALALFVLVKAIGKIKEKLIKDEKSGVAEPALPPEEVLLLREVRDLLKAGR